LALGTVRSTNNKNPHIRPMIKVFENSRFKSRPSFFDDFASRR
jgi:hypothetical protein